MGLKTKIILGVLLLLDLHIFCQDTFQRAYGGPGEETCNDLVTYENNLFLVGHTTTFGSGSYDILLIKTDPVGSPIWSTTYGKQAEEIALAASATNDGGLIMTGYSNSFGSDDILLVKTDVNGDVEWSKTYAGVISVDWGYDVRQINDGGYILTGMMYTSMGSNATDLTLIKTDENGNIQWCRIFGDEHINFGKKVIQTTDSGYLVVGTTHVQDGGPSDIYLIKTDNNGLPEWSKTYGGDGWDFGNFVAEKEDGFLVGGHGDLLAYGMSDIILMFLDFSGAIIWSKVYGGTGSEWGEDMMIDDDGNILITGFTNTTGSGLTDVIMINIDTDGNVIWCKVYGESNFDHGICMAPSNDQILISGYTESFGNGQNDMYLIKTDVQGISGCFENSWEIGFQDFSLQSDTLNFYSDFQPVTNSVLLDQQDQDVICESICLSSSINYYEQPGNLLVYPNPTKDNTTVAITEQFNSEGSSILIFNAQGAAVYQYEIPPGQNHFTFNTSSFSSGLYRAIVRNHKQGISRANFIVFR